MKTQRIQAAFARKREQEEIRVEKNEAMNRYFDHWGKVTSRFENWTNPKYYEQAGEKTRLAKEKEEKTKRIEERREKLRAKLAAEKAAYDAELLTRWKPGSARKQRTDTALMEKVGANLKAREDIKRRLELEAKLYGRWRHGVEDEGLIYGSKSSNNQVLAKLNWLDRQIEDQLHREKEEIEAQERKVRFQEELRKTEEHQKERQQIREQEIREIRALQEGHLEQLKERQHENDNLKHEETTLRTHLEELERELALLDRRTTPRNDPLESSSSSNNLTKIKMTIRKRAQSIRDQLKSDIEVLERVGAYANRSDMARHLIGKLNSQLEAEERSVAQVESMYESEAKHNLLRCEAAWQRQKRERQSEMRYLLENELRQFSGKLNENLQRQADLIDIRSTHLSSIESSNEKFKMLIKEQEESPRSVKEFVEESPRERSSLSGNDGRNTSSLQRATDSFTNLNLDVWKDVESVHGSTDSPRSIMSQQVGSTPDSNRERPKFGRKRVAWT